MTSKIQKRLVQQDVAIIFISILVAFMLSETKVFSQILVSTLNFQLIGSFIAGIFFTSVFTTAPAIVTLGEIANSNSIFLTAVFGALGALIGDLLIFRFVRDRLGEHLTELINHKSFLKRIRALFRLKSFRWVTFLFGGLIIASPLPDEIGIGLLGLSKMKTSRFMLISFLFNFLGILIIGIVANHL